MRNLRTGEAERDAIWDKVSVAIFCLAFFIVNHNLATLMKVAISVCLTLNAIEFVCFVVIFVELYKHHKRHVQLCLANKPNTASSKEKR